MAGSKKPSTAETAREIAQDTLKQLGLELWDVRFEKEGSSWYLRYFIDKPGGVNIQDCEDFSKAVDSLLDEADPISQSYILEVSSPGIERTLLKDEHFDQYIGHEVQVRLIRPVDGRRNFVGTLTERQGDQIAILLEDDVEMVFAKKEAAYVKLYARYDI